MLFSYLLILLQLQHPVIVFSFRLLAVLIFELLVVFIFDDTPLLPFVKLALTNANGLSVIL